MEDDTADAIGEEDLERLKDAGINIEIMDGSDPNSDSIVDEIQIQVPMIVGHIQELVNTQALHRRYGLMLNKDNDIATKRLKEIEMYDKKRLAASRKSKNIDANLIRQGINESHEEEYLTNILQRSKTFDFAIFVQYFSIFDAALEDTIKYIFKTNSLLNEAKSKLPYSALLELGITDSDKIRNRFIEEEIAQRYRNRFQQIKFVSENTDKKLYSSILDNLPVLIEAAERRNVIVHHKGMITHQYKDTLKKYKIELPQTDKKRLQLDSKYMDNVFYNLLTVMSKVAFAPLLYEEGKEEFFDTALIMIAVNCIPDKQYDQSLWLLELLKGLGYDGYSYYSYKAYCQKQLKDNDSFRSTLKILEGFDRDVLSDLEIAMLRGDIKGAVQIYQNIDDKKERQRVLWEINDTENVVLHELASVLAILGES